MDSARDLAALQRAADYVAVSKHVRGSGIGATFFGVIALFAGIFPPASVPLAALGGLLSVAGLWNVTNPHPIGILLSGACVAMVGVWNLVSAFAFTTAGGSPSVVWPVLGAFQLVWGVQSLQRYRRFAGAFEVRPGEAERKLAQQVMSELRRARARRSADVIEFATRGFTPRVVKARLMPEGAVCLVNRGDDVRFVGRDAFHMQVAGTNPLARAQKVRVRIGDLSLEASIASEYLERFEEWKGGSAASRPIAA